MAGPSDDWEAIYSSRGSGDASWFEDVPSMSLRMLEDAGMTSSSCVIDVGGGDSRLVAALVGRGLQCVAVLDMSAEALAHSRARLGARAATIDWIAADVTGEWRVTPRDIWHDRAAFPFLCTPAARAPYRTALVRTVRAGGAAIVATFAPDGPARCSGLPVRRYSCDQLALELGAEFELIDSQLHVHRPPWGAEQPFQYSRLRRGSADHRRQHGP